MMGSMAHRPSWRTRPRTATRVGALLLVCFALPTLTGCGFHLRGKGTVAFPAALSSLRVEIAGSRQENDPLLVAVRDALRTEARVDVRDQGELPVLLLQNERSETSALSLSTTGKALENLLKYEVSFQLMGAAGGEMVAAQTIRLRRDYTFDPLNVIAKQREEQELLSEMRRDAAQQIVRRLARVSPKR